LQLTVRYFAWVRERIGVSSETLALPADVRKVADLVAWLRGRTERHALALADVEAVRFAVDQRVAQPEESLEGASEVAFFPPMTGG